MTLFKLELRIRDWRIPNPLFMLLNIGYDLILEENTGKNLPFNNQIYLVRTQMLDWCVHHLLFMSIKISYNWDNAGRNFKYSPSTPKLELSVRDW